ncbi:MAG: hypothetical protein GY835_01235 [bacterium]|nr:hypothetical protein [bacterium]
MDILKELHDHSSRIMILLSRAACPCSGKRLTGILVYGQRCRQCLGDAAAVPGLYQRPDAVAQLTQLIIAEADVVGEGLQQTDVGVARIGKLSVNNRR